MLSVIIPTLNEAADLPETLRVLRRARRTHGPVQVIVSDCGSVDGTAGLIGDARLVTGGTSRATAMNLGAAAATGNVLLFLHADTRLPVGFDRAIRRAIRGGRVGGCFEFSFGSHRRNRGLKRRMLWLVQLVNRVRFRLNGRSYGDQGLFVRRDVFESLGGFDDVPLMEDARLARRLRLAGPTAVLHPAVKTSPRRFLERGIVRTTITDLWLIACEDLGLRPRGIWKRYNDHNHRGALSDQS